VRPLPPHVDLPALEQRVLQRWRDRDVFARTLAQTADGDPYVVFEGPPTANGHPGVHHVEARVFKDLFPRYQTMRGRSVPRRAGWDCHGLPVELAVEKELGFTRKSDIEAYGVAAFNARCRESVVRHVDEFEQLTERMGYWVDASAAYRTMDTSYIESVWWSLQQIFDAGLLVESHRVAPWCPRCQTGLSDHEVAQGYTDLVDPSVYVRLPLDDGADLLVWTTTPWTLVSNTAVAVSPDLIYARVRTDGRDVIVAADLVAAAVGPDAEVLATMTGHDLRGRHYTPPFDWLQIPDAHYVVLADYVTADEGTGLVHQSPAFGAEDMLVAREHGLPVVNPIRPDGTFEPEVPLVGGVFFKTADASLVDDLRERGLLWRYRPYEHTYPLCWRCDTALLYYATPSWYVRTTARRERLLEENARTEWHPETIRDGRYGEWLRGNVDWALSRKRYWGTPLPIWRCDTDPTHLVCVGSLAELGERAGQDLLGLDPHRPYVDDVELPCRECEGTCRRVDDVIDGWYDSGSMPFAQHGYPHLPGSREAFAAAYPADLVAEGIDQTRGWFYTLMAVGTLVFDRSSYDRVLCLGTILDETGRKMSKHVGNVLDPFVVMDQHGADALRWFMLVSGSPWSARRVGETAVGDVVRSLLLTYWNLVSFHTLYAAATSDWSPGPVEQPAVLDQWLQIEVADTVVAVTAALDAYDPTAAGRRIAVLVDDLSNFYVRRTRRRFWAGDHAALSTLHSALLTVTRLLAPFCPFLTDEVWEALRDGTGPDSVHLATWPGVPDVGWVSGALQMEVGQLRRLIELGRSARKASGVRTRQPLGRALVSGAEQVRPSLLRELADELNVLSVEPLTGAGELVDIQVKPAFRLLGKRFGPRTKEVAAQVSAERYDPVARTVTVLLDRAEHVLTGEELLVTETPREGWTVASGDGISIALDLALTPELTALGVAREAVRALNDARKATGLAVTDRVEVWWQAEGAVAQALREHGRSVAAEVLAVAFTEGTPPVDVEPRVDAALGLTTYLRVAGG